MTTTAPATIRNVAILGHKASGKTSLAEAMLFVAKSTPKLGKVDDKSSILDDTVEEKEHACSLEASVVHLAWNGTKINVVDTPGEGSFLSETRLAIAAVDAALLVVSARDGVQPITERVFGWCKAQGIPVFVVVSKVDVENAKPDDAVAEVRARLKVPVAAMEVHAGEGLAYEGVVALRTKKAWVGKPEAPNAVAPSDIPAGLTGAVEAGRGKLVDDVAGTNDDLTEKYLTEGDLTQDDLDKGLREAVSAGNLVPVFFASGTRPSGIAALLDAIVELVPPPSTRPPFKGTAPGGKAGAAPQKIERPSAPDAPAAAFVFKTSIDPHAGRMSYARVLSGVLRPDQTVLNTATGNTERLGKIFAPLVKEGKALDEAVAGDIVGLAKLKATRSGQTLADERQAFLFDGPDLPPPLFSRGVKFDQKGAEEKVASALQRLMEEDPGLSVYNDETTRELVVAGAGAQHLDVTVERIRRRVGIDCRLGPPHIAYKETITRKVANVEGKHKKQTGGHGQFGVCYIDMEPMPRGEGFVFDDAIVGGAIPRQFIPSVEKGVVKAAARGVLAGYQMIDFKVRLFDGKYHDVDSSDAAFQVAGRKAFKEAAAKANPVILEPIVKLQVTVPSAAMGDVIGDINSRRGRVLGTDTADDQTIVNAYVPLSEILEYESKLKSMTQGKGTFSMAIDHLEICPPMVQDKVIKDSGFKVTEEED